MIDDRRLAAATLASLPHITAARLRRMLEMFGGPRGALEAIGKARGDEVLRGDRDNARRIAGLWQCAVDVEGTRTRLERRGTHVWLDGHDDYPVRDPVPGRPAVLFGEGAGVEAFAAPRVAIVGTRSASPHGLTDAREIAAHLAAAGVTVVSGLAIGIDGAAHEGALGAGGYAAAVVGTGLDVTYPRRHRALYARVRERGVIVSEYAYGVPPHPTQFPERNRIIAALCDVCVVVEAKAVGGAAITAGYANSYSRTVFALPGARRNRAAVGCNALIKDGATVLLDPGDVLIELGKGRAGENWQAPLPLPLEPDEACTLATLAGEPGSVDQLVLRTRLPAARLAGALRRLEAAGHIARSHGRWWPS